MRLLLPCLAVLVGCRFSMVEPQPLAGQAPGSIAVWPTVPREFALDEAALLTGLDVAVRSRGYRTVSLAVGREMLEQAGLLEPHAPAPKSAVTVGLALSVDAVLELEVREFATSPNEMRDARWDLLWRLTSTRGGGVLWEYAHRGSWNRSDEHRADPTRGLEAEPDIQPIGGPRTWSFRDSADLAANLHRLALAKLPQARR